ncbi:MAG: cbb3-type cytochrome c oxidase subunit 3 [Rhodoplanes sp.]|jgi:cytochrome c oxidase cbb3-type subunit 4
MRIEPAVSLISDFIATWWTPLFIALFLAVVAYAFWPRNRAKFDEASKLPLRED